MTDRATPEAVTTEVAEPTKADHAIIAEMVRAVAGVIQAAAPLVCDTPSNCHEEAKAERLRAAARDTSTRLSGMVGDLSTDCLQSAANLYVGAVESYAVFGRAMMWGTDAEMIGALDAADAAAAAAATGLRACGYLKGGQTIGLEASLAFQRINLEAWRMLMPCLPPSCAAIAARIETAAALQIRRMKQRLRGVESPCLRRLTLVALDLLTTYRHFSRASTRSQQQVVNRDARRVGTLAAALGRQAQVCAGER